MISEFKSAFVVSCLAAAAFCAALLAGPQSARPTTDQSKTASPADGMPPADKAKSDADTRTDWVSMLPEDEAKEMVVKLCGRCHGLKSTVTQRRTEKQWRATVDDMIGRGAQIFIEEADTIVAYLAKHLAPEAGSDGSNPVDPETLDVNNVTADQLIQVLKLDGKLARQIVSYRAEHGNFKQVEDVSKVPGMNAALFEKISKRLFVKKQ